MRRIAESPPQCRVAGDLVRRQMVHLSHLEPADRGEARDVVPRPGFEAGIEHQQVTRFEAQQLFSLVRRRIAIGEGGKVRIDMRGLVGDPARNESGQRLPAARPESREGDGAPRWRRLGELPSAKIGASAPPVPRSMPTRSNSALRSCISRRRAPRAGDAALLSLRSAASRRAGSRRSRPCDPPHRETAVL